MWFPTESAKAKILNGVWEIDFPQFRTDRVLQWISLQGPNTTTVKVYVDTIFMDITPRGDANRADYYVGIPIARGQVLRLLWNVGTGTAPTASIGTTDGKTGVSGIDPGSGTIFTSG